MVSSKADDLHLIRFIGFGGGKAPNSVVTPDGISTPRTSF
jgi:hypothetical protein